MSNLAHLNQTALPYNSQNKLIDERNVIELLSIFDSIGSINIYRRAFVHKSYCTRKNENFVDGNTHCPSDCLPLQEENNERLEFLGDAILHLVIAKYLFQRYPDVNEGFLTTTRTKLVNGDMLAFLSNCLGLKEFVLLSSQIEANNGRQNKNILEDTFEAFIGAIFLDFEEKCGNGFKYANDWIIHVIETYVDFAELMTKSTSHKDRLVKYCQHNFQFIPKFYEIDVTEVHGKRVHTIYVKNNMGVVIAIGKGNTKKAAELDGAEQAMNYYQGM